MSLVKSKTENNRELETTPPETIGTPPCGDGDVWRKRYPAALATLDPQRLGVLSLGRKRMQWIAILAVVTAAATCVSFVLWHFNANRPSRSNTNALNHSTFFQTVEQIHKAKSITWSATIYERMTSKDGKRQWCKMTRKKTAFKAPGLYRNTVFDEDGNVESIEITDAVNKKGLALYPSNKTAAFFEFRSVSDADGPFADARRILREDGMEFVEMQKTTSGEFNLFRNVAGKCFFDCWIDEKSKQLVEYHLNRGDKVMLSEYENDARYNAVQEKESSASVILGSITTEIEYDTDLNDSLFRLDVPKDYFTINRAKLTSLQDL
jgi:hypothetical protein